MFLSRWLTIVSVFLLSAAALGCQVESRPVTVETIGDGTGGSVSVSAVAAPAPTPAMSSKFGDKGIFIPVGLEPETSGPTKSDGIFTATTNREIYQKISTDYQEIATLANRVKDGEPLPAAEILLLYEAGMHTRLGASSRSLRAFARSESRAKEYPVAAEFYGTPTFLDTHISDVIRNRRSAEGYTPAQQSQAIKKGILRIIYHWSRRYVQNARETLNEGWVDEAWAIYVGEEKDGKYPNSLAAVAQSREANFNRPGTLDTPLREALSRAQQAATNDNQEAYDAAANDVYSRYHAIFYLCSVRYLNEAVKAVQGGDVEKAKTAMVEGYSYYLNIQPQVALADAAANQAIVDFYTGDATKLTTAMRDSALAAINGTAGALMLKDSDLVRPADFQ